MRRSSVGALVAFCGSLLLAGAALAAPANVASLDVVVVDQDGQGVSDALVLVETSEGAAFLLVTDEDGHARIDLKVRGQEALDVKVSVLGGSSLEETLQRGDSLTEELTMPLSRGYEWAWVD